MPAIPLKLIHISGNMTPETLGLVDSGCDTTMLPAGWAKILGLDLAKDCVKQQSNTAGGTTTNYAYRPGIDAIVMGRKIHLQASFNPGLPVILLGREDFFSLYRVTFDQRVSSFTVEAY
jgi:Aspartyl protease